MPAIFTSNYIKERVEKDEKYFRIYDYYTPDYKKTMLTRKFYSRCEGLDLSLADPEIVKKIIEHKYARPNQRYSWPQTENQQYGWFSELFPIDKSDTRFYHPRVSTDFVAHAMRLKRDEQEFPKPKFTGEPFRFQ